MNRVLRAGLLAAVTCAFVSTGAQAAKERVLYSFSGGSDGGGPYAGPIFDKAGNLYGTATAGGSSGCGQGCGTVYELSPGKSGWTYTVLYSFTG
ncbi:MAG: hypothetical protein JOY77_00715, partial [Alphaproteobacteria bacterium]|nr:hypothetical protein [Alphaproteobacteria bacterium]